MVSYCSLAERKQSRDFGHLFAVGPSTRFWQERGTSDLMNPMLGPPKRSVTWNRLRDRVQAMRGSDALASLFVTKSFFLLWRAEIQRRTLNTMAQEMLSNLTSTSLWRERFVISISNPRAATVDCPTPRPVPFTPLDVLLGTLRSCGFKAASVADFEIELIQCVFPLNAAGKLKNLKSKERVVGVSRFLSCLACVLRTFQQLSMEATPCSSVYVIRPRSRPVFFELCRYARRFPTSIYLFFARVYALYWPLSSRYFSLHACMICIPYTRAGLSLLVACHRWRVQQ